MNSVVYIIFLTALVGLELVYFRIARHFHILDHPNDRSLHEVPTIRGGGIILYLSAAMYYAIAFRPDPFFFIALTLVSFVGFLDDIKSLSSLVRLMAQCIAFLLVMLSLDLSNFSYVMIVIAFIVVVGAINTFNFMDGINGITAGYGLVALGCLLYVNLIRVHFADNDFILSIGTGIIVFGFFNFRKKAICFAGDVGSMALGFMIIYLILSLIVVSGNYTYVFFLSVYGVDSVLTIVYRIFRRENIFKPHKLHLFQVLIDHFNIPHLRMSMAYAGLQLAINFVIISSLSLSPTCQYLIDGILILALAGVYVLVKMKIPWKGPKRSNNPWSSV